MEEAVVVEGEVPAMATPDHHRPTVAAVALMAMVLGSAHDHSGKAGPQVSGPLVTGLPGSGRAHWVAQQLGIKWDERAMDDTIHLHGGHRLVETMAMTPAKAVLGLDRHRDSLLLHQALGLGRQGADNHHKQEYIFDSGSFTRADYQTFCTISSPRARINDLELLWPLVYLPR